MCIDGARDSRTGERKKSYTENRLYIFLGHQIFDGRVQSIGSAQPSVSEGVPAVAVTSIGSIIHFVEGERLLSQDILSGERKKVDGRRERRTNHRIESNRRSYTTNSAEQRMIIPAIVCHAELLSPAPHDSNNNNDHPSSWPQLNDSTAHSPSLSLSCVCFIYTLAM